MNSEGVVGVSFGVSISTRLLFSLTGDFSKSSIIWNSIRKSPVEFEGVDEFENFSSCRGNNSIDG